MKPERIQELVRKVDADPASGEVLWRIRSDDGTLDASYGDPARPFFIASATKLFVTAILAQLRTEGRLDWDSAIADHVPDLDLTGLQIPAGTTVRSVMAHTSGLADYFEGKRPDGPVTFARALTQDFAWDVHDVIEWTSAMPPGTPGKGLYSDTGYQLLGAMIERIDGRGFATSVAARITEPLGMGQTYCFGPETMGRYREISPLMYGDRALHIPLAMASVQADGGIVSTLDDGLVFLDSFFGGRLFPSSILAEIQQDWHRIFYPLEYGTGIMRLRLPAVMTGFRRVPPFIGHSGASGTVMFRCPDRGVTVVGTVNQVKQRSMPYKLLVRTVT